MFYIIKTATKSAPVADPEVEMGSVARVHAAAALLHESILGAKRTAREADNKARQRWIEVKTEKADSRSGYRQHPRQHQQKCRRTKLNIIAAHLSTPVELHARLWIHLELHYCSVGHLAVEKGEGLKK